MKRYAGGIRLESIMEQAAMDDALDQYTKNVLRLADPTFDDLKDEVRCTVDMVEREFANDRPTVELSVPQQEVVLPGAHGVLALAVLLVARDHSENPMLQQMCGTMIAEYRDSQASVSPD